MDEHSRLGIKINYRKRRIDDRSSLGKAVQYLEKAKRNWMYNFHLADLYSLMQRLFIVGKYHKTIALLNKHCEEGLPQGYSMHDCDQEFYIQVDCHFKLTTKFGILNFLDWILIFLEWKC
jgi:hypothetical protein